MSIASIHSTLDRTSQMHQIHLRRCFPVIALLLVSASIGCVTPSYAGEVHEAIELAFGSGPFKSYTCRSHPIGRFGAGSMYTVDVETGLGDPEGGWFLGDSKTWFSDEVTPAEREELLEDIIAEGSLGSIGLGRDISSSLGLTAVLPADVIPELSAKGDVSLDAGVTVRLFAQQAINRRINWDEFMLAAEDGKLNRRLTRRLETGQPFIMGLADVVLEGYTVVVAVDRSVGGELDAHLSGLVGKVLSDQTIEFKVEARRGEQGVYAVVAQEPVIACVKYERPPEGEPFEASRDVSNWEPSFPDPEVLDLVDRHAHVALLVPGPTTGRFRLE